MTQILIMSVETFDSDRDLRGIQSVQCNEKTHLNFEVVVVK
jgi:hypothetical protein